MKLTDTKRDSILRAIVQDLFLKDINSILEKEKAIAIKIMRDSAPAAFSTMVKGKPYHWFRCPGLSSPITYDINRAAETTVVSTGNVALNVPVPYTWDSTDFYIKLKATPSFIELREEAGRIITMISEIKGALNSSRSIRTVEKKFPELYAIIPEKYKVDSTSTASPCLKEFLTSVAEKPKQKGKKKR